MRIEPDDPNGDWTAEGVYEVTPGLYRIPLPLATDGLKAVNVYAMRDGDGLVLVDSGWSIDEARAVLDKALSALDCGFSDVHRFLITHVHRDHYTLAVKLRREFGNRISLGEGERRSIELTLTPGRPPGETMLQQLLLGGGRALYDELFAEAESERHTDPSEWGEPDDWIAAPNDDVVLTDRTLQAVQTPGHTQGHVVFVDADRDLMFAGDHVLPHITPSVGFEANLPRSPLGDYLQSLRLVRGMPDRRMLPAHGPVSPSVHARVDQILAHHAERLDTMYDLVAAGAATAFETAGQLTWTRRGKKLLELEGFHRCMAVVETSAHLDLLAEQGRLQRTLIDGAYYYRP